MCSMSVLCPLCAQLSFTSIDALRASLIKAANGPLACPICSEMFLGLDKLTIHLFSHTSLMATTAPITTTTAELKPPSAEKALEFNSTQVLSKEKNTKQDQQLGRNASTEPRLNSPQQQVILTNGYIEEVPAACDICEFTFRNAQLRDMHFRLVHQNLNSNQESVTAPTTTADISGDPPFKCHLCAKAFKMKGSLRVHLKVVHMMGLPYVNNSPKLTICDRIRHKEAKSTTKVTQTQTLQPTLTSNANAFSIGTLTGSVLNINANGELMHSADACGLNSNVLLVFNTNSPTMSFPVSVPPAPQSELDTETAGKVTTTDNPKIWDCDVCAKAFTTKYFLKKHKRLHTGEMPYTCEICARTFTFQQSYHKHLLYHSDARPHVCSTCGRAFKELSTLHNHERIHSGEKPFKCEVCGKCFRQRVSFLVHTRIHTGVMPYKCDVCEKSFRYKVSQRTHKCLSKILDTSNADTEETLDHISESFIKAFLESPTSSSTHNHYANDLQHSPNSTDMPEMAADCNGNLDSKTILDEALLTKAIDDIVVESCNKMGIVANDGLSPDLLTGSLDSSVGQHCNNDGSNSPSQKLQNMHLHSPQSLTEMESGFPHFLLDDDGNNNLI